MLKDYKAVALKNSEGSGCDSYTFIIKGNNREEALLNAQNHIEFDHKASAKYHIELSYIGKSLTE
ncbi:hypothetical protein [[Muricauda] lutisoli]|uniref:DUF4242 domain-containing protein n=1 Tax=[Muricauda] lutisoli TaxID=2816035 RepID=A0ABS3EUS8_9FLAO|nr:hypothetical protein [[Muricauda] lutisoli]MBO0329882.1 hypothetical protein [[Muricauda] lutisoli]